jgi:UPF0716 family protein affecting phage T7 exclusion
MHNINEIMQGKLSKEDFYKNNISKLFGALFLMIPGFFTDILGIVLLSGLLNSVLFKVFKNKISKAAKTKQNKEEYTSGYIHKTKNTKNNDNIIDVEVIESLQK